jgi:myosin heavy subunit
MSLVNSHTFRPDITHATALRDLFAKYRCSAAEAQLEHCLALANNSDLVLDFIRIMPNSLPNLVNDLRDRVDELRENPRFLALPASVLGRILFTNWDPSIPPRSPEIDSAARNLIDRGNSPQNPEELAKEQRTIAAESAQIQEKVDQLEADSTELTQKCQSVEEEAGEVEAATEEKRGHLATVRRQLDQENSKLAELNAEMDALKKQIEVIKKEKAAMEAETKKVLESLK